MKYALALILCAISLTALAKPPLGLTLDPEISSWFRSLSNPITGQYCCDQSDGKILRSNQWRSKGDTIEVEIADGVWVPVPQNVILRHVPNPTGSAVAFWTEPFSGFYCFVYPEMG